MKAIKYIASAALAATLGLWGASADAFTWGACSGYGYSPDATGKLMSNDACNLNTSGGTSNPSLADLNGLFGVNDWLGIGTKVDVQEVNGVKQSIDLDQNVSGGSIAFKSSDVNFSGIWSISQSLLDMYDHVAIVMKDGNQAPAPTIAYKISDTEGTWGTPWGSTSQPNNSLSNVRFVGQGVSGTPMGAVPLPAGVWLMIAAFGTLGAAARYKKKLAIA